MCFVLMFTFAYFALLTKLIWVFLFFYKQLRRQARLRREYLYRKSTEDKERVTYERKKKLKTALEGKRRKLLFDEKCTMHKFH